MKFTLYYHGLLPSAANSARLPEKHAIRKAVHLQLVELMNRDQNLPKVPGGQWHNWEKWKWPVIGNPAWGEDNTVVLLGTKHFVPLVRKGLHLHCELDVLFLRHGEPGSIINSGDIDNRLLTLSDGLRLPKNEQEIAYMEGQNDFPQNEPVFCLLEDDALISRWNVKTDRLLDQVEHDLSVRLIIEVRLKATKVVFQNLELLGD